MERAGGGEECYSQANSDKHLGTLTKPNGLATTRFSPRIKERRRVLFDDRARRSDAEARRKWLEAEVDNTDRVSRLQVKYMDAKMRDPDFKARLDKLVEDYNLLFKDSAAR